MVALNLCIPTKDRKSSPLTNWILATLESSLIKIDVALAQGLNANLSYPLNQDSEFDSFKELHQYIAPPNAPTPTNSTQGRVSHHHFD
jgi:hypothetical protein